MVFDNEHDTFKLSIYILKLFKIQGNVFEI